MGDYNICLQERSIANFWNVDFVHHLAPHSRLPINILTDYTNAKFTHSHTHTTWHFHTVTSELEVWHYKCIYTCSWNGSLLFSRVLHSLMEHRRVDCVIQTIPVKSAKNRRTAAKDKLVHGAVCRGAGIPTSPSFSHCRQWFSFL